MKMFIPWDDRMEWKIAEGFGMEKSILDPISRKVIWKDKKYMIYFYFTWILR